MSGSVKYSCGVGKEKEVESGGEAEEFSFDWFKFSLIQFKLPPTRAMSHIQIMPSP